MRIVLPGALPDPHEARELLPHLERSAPTLAAWFRTARAQSHTADPANTGCTPFEYWQLLQHGFTPPAGKNFATGLGPLYAGPTVNDDKPVWLAELVHVSPSREGAALLPADELNITAQDSVALFDSVHALARESGFELEQTSNERWRIHLPEECEPVTVASPTLVSLTSVNDWWDLDDRSRSWRRLANEIQMLWFDHPVNQLRYERQQVPINSLWLFGGALKKNLVMLHANTHTQLLLNLQEAATRHDWGLWLQALQTLETQIFAPLAKGPAPELVLTGTQRFVVLEPRKRLGLLAHLTVNKTSWRNWWSPQN